MRTFIRKNTNQVHLIAYHPEIAGEISADYLIIQPNFRMLSENPSAYYDAVKKMLLEHKLPYGVESSPELGGRSYYLRGQNLSFRAAGGIIISDKANELFAEKNFLNTTTPDTVCHRARNEQKADEFSRHLLKETNIMSTLDGRDVIISGRSSLVAMALMDARFRGSIQILKDFMETTAEHFR